MGPRSAPARKAAADATLANIEARFARVLPSAFFQKPSAGLLSRNRIFPGLRIFWCWIWQILQVNTSCREVVRQIQCLLEINGCPAAKPGTAGYCQARLRLPLDWAKKALAKSWQAAAANSPETRLLQGRSIQVLDATGIRLPDTPSNRKQYPARGNQFERPFFPVMKVLALFSLASGAIKSVAIGSWLDHDLRLLRKLADSLTPGQIAVADRAFGHFLAALWLRKKDVDLIARVATNVRRIDFRQALRRIGKNDALFTWCRRKIPSPLVPPEEWNDLPTEITVRIIRTEVRKAGFRTRQITVMTTLVDPAKYSAIEILEAYAARWKLELCFDDLKTTMGMEMLTCQSSVMVEKELLMYLTAYNLIRWIMADAAEGARATLEHLSFKGAFDAFRQCSQALARVGSSARKSGARERLWQQMLRTIAEDRVPFRPGRREPRAIKRPTKYDSLRKPRHLFVDRPSRRTRARQATEKRNAGLK